ncbi:hypothetical protein LCGC14_1450980 [marine sediment metagenome]|uniref:Uncharacterized protein n=1 Tax=marine sediment metagenome TaxID=412755 RepID=A0A0F9MJN8_9ZZZZ
MKYKNLILIMMCFILSGCGSLIPRITMGTPNTLPQSVVKSKAKTKCSGRIDYYENGTVKSCTKGYSGYDQGYNKQERKMTIIERVKSFINGLMGWGFWGLLLLFILCPSLIGMVVGRLIEGTVGVTGKALKATVSAISKAKKNGKNYTEELGRAHSQDKAVQKKINELRAEV